MMSFIIEVKGEVKEAFSYERPLSEASRQALVEYALANYGADAMLRNMTDGEETDFILYGELFFKKKSRTQKARR